MFCYRWEDVFSMKRFSTKKLSESFVLWTIGGTIYYMIEVLFRGFSHWSMFVLGGICMVFFGKQGLWTEWEDPIWKQVLRCTLFITAGEFITGIFVNKLMKWDVWDYSDQPMNLFGQICMPFVILFSGLCVIGLFLSGYLLHWIYKEKAPHFHVV